MIKTEKLLQLKQGVADAKTNIAMLQGKQGTLTETLKKKWKCSTKDQAVKKSKVVEKEISGLDDQINKNSLEIERKY